MDTLNMGCPFFLHRIRLASKSRQNGDQRQRKCLTLLCVICERKRKADAAAWPQVLCITRVLRLYIQSAGFKDLFTII